MTVPSNSITRPPRAADGTGTPIRLTDNTEEERAPDWCHQGDRIAYMCHGGSQRFEFCVTDVNGNQTQPTDNDLPHLTAAWSPDDQSIFFNGPHLGGETRSGGSPPTAPLNSSLSHPKAPTGSTFFPNVGVRGSRSTSDDVAAERDPDATPGGWRPAVRQPRHSVAKTLTEHDLVALLRRRRTLGELLRLVERCEALLCVDRRGLAQSLARTLDSNSLCPAIAIQPEGS